MPDEDERKKRNKEIADEVVSQIKPELEHIRGHGKKDVDKMAEDDDEKRRLRQNELLREIDDKMQKCIGDHCDIIAEKAKDKVMKDLKVSFSSLEAEISKNNKTGEERQRKLDEQLAKTQEHIANMHKEVDLESGKNNEFRSRFMNAVKDEVVPTCPNCQFKRDDLAYEKTIWECPRCGGKLSSQDKANKYKRCPGCGCPIDWDRKYKKKE